jgi:hypothetical protein
MAWNYSGNPSSSPKDATRFLIGDTDSCDQLLQDGEIEYFLGMYNNAPINAAIRCVETIMSKFSRKARRSPEPARDRRYRPLRGRDFEVGLPLQYDERKYDQAGFLEAYDGEQSHIALGNGQLRGRERLAGRLLVNLQARKPPLDLSIAGQLSRLTDENLCAICGIKLKRDEYIKETGGTQIVPEGTWAIVRMHLTCGPESQERFH